LDINGDKKYPCDRHGQTVKYLHVVTGKRTYFPSVLKAVN